jgi:putative Mg2+ transporter-C (MgtC) family protein
MLDVEALLDTLAAVDPMPLVLSVLLGGAIGLEREWHSRPAGLRTHILVCISATMLTMISRAVALEAARDGLEGAARLVFDPNRMAAGIVTGIGFLGAATVIRSGDFVRGITTAACIWFVAGLGIVLGTGHYALAVVGTVAVLFVLTLINRVASVIRPTVYRRLIVLARTSDVAGLLAGVQAELTSQGMQVLDVASGHDNETQRVELVLFLALKNQLQAPVITERIAKLEGVTSARWKPIA